MLTVKTVENTRLNEKYVEAVHESGLKILICPKPEFATSHAIFGTRYGSIDTKFRIKGETEFTEVPEGIAHFLEHKLFESEDGDAFSRFSATGASANAYTSFDRTCYLFSCTERFDENLDILLDFVRHPYFTEQTVQKEQGIIGQEIRMYDDDAGWRVFFNLLCSVYSEHPVRIDIAGTVESIAKIDAALLYKCYETFYNPSNMFLCIAGPVSPDAILARVDEVMKAAKGVEIERGTFNEPAGVLRERVEVNMPVAQPLFSIGYKEDCSKNPEKSLKERVETDILLEMLAGKSSRLYNDLLDKGLINDQFGCSYFTGYGVAVEMFEGESASPDAVAEAIEAELERLRRDGVDENEFIRAKNALYGKSVRMYNSVERIATALVGAAIEGCGIFEVQEIYDSVTKSDIDACVKRQMSLACRAISVVNPIK